MDAGDNLQLGRVAVSLWNKQYGVGLLNMRLYQGDNSKIIGFLVQNPQNLSSHNQELQRFLSCRLAAIVAIKELRRYWSRIVFLKMHVEGYLGKLENDHLQ